MESRKRQNSIVIPLYFLYVSLVCIIVGSVFPLFFCLALCFDLPYPRDFLLRRFIVPNSRIVIFFLFFIHHFFLPEYFYAPQKLGVKPSFTRVEAVRLKTVAKYVHRAWPRSPLWAGMHGFGGPRIPSFLRRRGQPGKDELFTKQYS